MSEYKAGIIPAASQMGRELREWLEKWHFPATIMLFDEAEKAAMCEHSTHEFFAAPNDSLLASCDIVFDCDEEHPVSLPLPHHAYIIHLGRDADHAKLLIPSLNLAHFQPEDHEIQIPFAAFLLFAKVCHVTANHQQVNQAILTSLHSTAEMGDDACQDLLAQLRAYAQGEPIESQCFPLYDSHPHLPLLFQALPQTSHFSANGDSEEERLFHRYAAELSYDLALNATCVRTPSLRGLSMSLTFICADVLNVNRLIDAFSSDPAIICFDDAPHNMYPICADVLHDYRIYIGRMRKSDDHTFTAWAVCDDLAIRCSAAVQLAFYILHNFL